MVPQVGRLCAGHTLRWQSQHATCAEHFVEMYQQVHAYAQVRSQLHHQVQQHITTTSRPETKKTGNRKPVRCIGVPNSSESGNCSISFPALPAVAPSSRRAGASCCQPVLPSLATEQAFILYPAALSLRLCWYYGANAARSADPAFPGACCRDCFTAIQKLGPALSRCPGDVLWLRRCATYIG
jgi:hypothetical protein